MAGSKRKRDIRKNDLVTLDASGDPDAERMPVALGATGRMTAMVEAWRPLSSDERRLEAAREKSRRLREGEPPEFEAPTMLRELLPSGALMTVTEAQSAPTIEGVGRPGMCLLLDVDTGRPYHVDRRHVTLA